MSRGWGGGSTRAWRQIREAVIIRDGGICRAHRDGWCAKAKRATEHTCTQRADLAGEHAGHAHHTRGKRHGDNPEHIVAACKSCNLHIGDPEQSVDPQPKPVTRW